MFRVGQKVTVIPEAPFHLASYHPGAAYPMVGAAYTIRQFAPDRPELILLDEIDNSHLGDIFEPGFHQKWFRPLVERKTSIEIFQRMLRTTKESANV